jgi:ABC-type branched-subunit amino acid transport system substrate-binding protein
MRRPLGPNIAVFARTMAAVCLLWPVLMAAQLTPAQAAGKHIYKEGVSPSNRPIEAVLGEGSTRVPGRLMPCASCHGLDGKGRPEGGVVPSQVTWDILTSPQRKADVLGRQRRAYDLASLRRAITQSVDPAGHHLGATMPGYRLSPQDMDHLIQYLRVLGRDADPGLTESTIRVGAIAPLDGALATSGRSSVALLQAYFDELNQQGGIYGRKIELRTMAAQSMLAVQNGKQNLAWPDDIFAAISVLPPDAEHEQADSMEQPGIPTIGAFASRSRADDSGQSKTFYVLSGLPQQARVLVKFARQHIEDPLARIAVIYPESAQDLADVVIDECRTTSLDNLELVKFSTFTPDLVAESLSHQRVRSVFFLGRDKELQEMLESAAKLGWIPTVFQPGPLAGHAVFAVPPAFDQHIFLAFPMLASDLHAEAINEYKSLAKKYNLVSAQPAITLTALAAAKILVEGLRESGRQLSRDKLITILSGIYGFNTGLTPPLTFTATRRIGALGGYVVRLDLKNNSFTPVDSWMVP